MTESPWILEAKDGQKINLTMTNFNWQKEDIAEEDCPLQLGYIFDVNSENIVNVCAGNSRLTHLYTTTGSQLHLLLDKAAMQDSHFMIRFEGTEGIVCNS